MRECADALAGVDYFKKLTISEALLIFSKEAISIFKRVNCVRRAFAHNYKDENSDYKYRGISIFKKEAINILLEDQKKVIKESSDLIMGYARKGSKL